MKLTKALKFKNQLAGELAELKERLKEQNSREATVPFDYDTAEVLTDVRSKIQQLVEVKAAIASANVDQYARIFRLAELKGLVSTLKNLNVRHGVFKEGGGYTEPVYKVEYIAQIKKADVDALISELENEIAELQDQLDEFNHVTRINLPS